MTSNSAEYIPKFVGFTKDAEKIVLYKLGDDFYLLRPDKTMVALSRRSEISTYFDEVVGTMHVGITSPEWTGTATGTRFDLISEPVGSYEP